MSDPLAILRHVRAGWIEALCANGPTVDVGPFVCSFDADSDLTWINYAVPAFDAQAKDWDDTLPRLRDVFAEHDRKLRFEFFDELTQGFEGWCLANGLARQAEMPAMYLAAADFAATKKAAGAASSDVVAVDARADDRTFAEYFAVVDACFSEAGYEPPPFDTRVASLRRQLADGVSRLSVIEAAGRVIAAASLNGRGPVVELVGVVTHPDFRRRGCARRLSLRQASSHFARGGVAVWLSAGNETARRVYESIGFNVLGKQFAYVSAD